MAFYLCVFCEQLENFEDLRGEFSGGQDNQGPNMRHGAFDKFLNNRDQKSDRFPGPGGGLNRVIPKWPRLDQLRDDCTLHWEQITDRSMTNILTV